eukprot:3549574-Amphidinium_carterae.1
MQFVEETIFGQRMTRLGPCTWLSANLYKRHGEVRAEPRCTCSFIHCHFENCFGNLYQRLNAMGSLGAKGLRHKADPSDRMSPWEYFKRPPQQRNTLTTKMLKLALGMKSYWITAFRVC